MADQAVIYGGSGAESGPGAGSGSGVEGRGGAGARLGVPGQAGWTLGLFRGVATLYALAAVAQPFLAGLFLSGSFSALKAHEVTGQAVGGLGLLTLVCAILLWRLRGASRAVVGMSAGVLVAVVLELFLGYDRSLALHVPLGVGIVAGVVRLALLSWRGDER